MLPNRVTSRGVASDAASFKFADRWSSGPYRMYSLGTATITILLLIGGYQLWRRTRLPLPPGPKGLPWIGNVLQLRDKRWLLSPGCLEKYGATRVLGLLLSILTIAP
jgi:hypothetical protein